MRQARPHWELERSLRRRAIREGIVTSATFFAALALGYIFLVWLFT